MESNVKISAQLIKTLREARGWSQDHLATVAGVGLRTVQRVEAEGAASAETRMALASALEVAPASLLPQGDSQVPLSQGHKWGLILGMGGAASGTLLAWVGIALGDVSGEDAGIAAGVAGLIGGLSMGIIGLLSNRYGRVNG